MVSAAADGLGVSHRVSRLHKRPGGGQQASVHESRGKIVLQDVLLDVLLIPFDGRENTPEFTTFAHAERIEAAVLTPDQVEGGAAGNIDGALDAAEKKRSVLLPSDLRGAFRGMEELLPLLVLVAAPSIDLPRCSDRDRLPIATCDREDSWR